MFRKLFTIVLGLAILGGFAVAEAHEEVNLELRVKLDLSSFDVAMGDFVGIGGAFYVTGSICKELGPVGTCDPIGTFHCWGWLFDASDEASSAVVSQEFNLDGRGKIQVQGVEDEGPRAVTGELVISETCAERPAGSIFPTSSAMVNSPGRSTSSWMMTMTTAIVTAIV